MPKTCALILEYCGGKATDQLYAKLQQGNPSYRLEVLDNASPTNRASCVTMQMPVNTFVGGGIQEAIYSARSQGAVYLMFFTNDIVPLTLIDISYFEQLLDRHPQAVQVSAAFSPDSDSAGYYPWMVQQPENQNRLVPHADLLCCMLRLEFLHTFGGFPDCRSGYGYDLELGYQARKQNKQVIIADRFCCRHSQETDKASISGQSHQAKVEEMKQVYNRRYGDWRMIVPKAER